MLLLASPPGPRTAATALSTAPPFRESRNPSPVRLTGQNWITRPVPGGGEGKGKRCFCHESCFLPQSRPRTVGSWPLLAEKERRCLLPRLQRCFRARELGTAGAASVTRGPGQDSRGRRRALEPFVGINRRPVGAARASLTKRFRLWKAGLPRVLRSCSRCHLGGLGNVLRLSVPPFLICPRGRVAESVTGLFRVRLHMLMHVLPAL